MKGVDVTRTRGKAVVSVGLSDVTLSLSLSTSGESSEPIDGFASSPNVDCSSLIHWLLFENASTSVPSQLLSCPCVICGCIANHNGYIGLHVTDGSADGSGDVGTVDVGTRGNAVDTSVGCEACGKWHPGQLCDPSDLVCSVCQTRKTSICLFKDTTRIKTAYLNETCKCSF